MDAHWCLWRLRRRTGSKRWSYRKKHVQHTATWKRGAADGLSKHPTGHGQRTTLTQQINPRTQQITGQCTTRTTAGWQKQTKLPEPTTGIAKTAKQAWTRKQNTTGGSRTIPPQERGNGTLSDFCRTHRHQLHTLCYHTMETRKTVETGH